MNDEYGSPIRGVVVAFVPSLLAWAAIIAAVRWLGEHL